MKVYLSGPIAGLSYEEASAWRNELTDQFQAAGIQTIDPLRRRMFAYTGDKDTTPNEIVTRDLQDVRTSDLVFIWLPRMSIGTICELWESYRLQKPVVLVTSEAAIATHPWVQVAATRVFANKDTAVEYILRRWHDAPDPERYVPEKF